MRNRVLLRLVGAAVLATASLLSLSTSASAFVGFSDKQKAHIDEYIHCKILLLTDLAAFEAEQPPCGGTPNADLKSIAATGSGGGEHRKPNCDYPTDMVTTVVQIPDCEPR
ncbi:hypothetical protein [Devosia sp. CN2-171]|uniref:hypothetical protein n=1 Tax=Devosia sp. CN2-171 TaxID=3400909 RepID=UPI003BF872E3